MIKYENLMLTLTLMMVTQSVNHNLYCTHGIVFHFSHFGRLFGFSDPLRQYFSLYRAVSQREGERGEKG